MNVRVVRWLRAPLLAVALASGWVAPLRAQDTLSVAARLVMRQPAGVVLRLNAANEQVTGLLERVDAGTVHLTGPERAIPLVSITDAWLQRRSTARGGKIGGIVGASAGAAVSGAGIALLSGLCEYECDDLGAGDIAVAALIGGAAGGAAGYLVGAIIGASVPRWEPLTETSAPPTVAPPGSRRPAGLSALSVTTGAAMASGHDGTGLMLTASYLSQLSRHIAVGGEIARYGIATGIVPPYPCGDPEVLCGGDDGSEGARTIAGLGRLGTGSDGRVEPFALVGLGVTDFGSVTLGSYTLGGGVRVRPGGGRIAVSGEARWHSNFTRSGDDSQLGLYTAGVAISLLR